MSESKSYTDGSAKGHDPHHAPLLLYAAIFFPVVEFFNI